MKIYYFKGFRDYLILLFQFFIGVYISSVRLNNPDSFYLDDLYFYAREGRYLDLLNNTFDVQVIMSVLDLLIIIPMVCGKFNESYKKKCCYFATHYGSFGKFYTNEIVNMAFTCFLYELFYCAGILVFAIYKSNLTVNSSQFFILFIQTIVNSAIILFAFAVFSVLLSSINEKIGISIALVLFMILAVLLFILPKELKQLDIVSLYFVSDLMSNKQLFSYPPVSYYFLLFILNAGLILLGYSVFKKKDVL